MPIRSSMLVCSCVLGLALVACGSSGSDKPAETPAKSGAVKPTKGSNPGAQANGADAGEPAGNAADAGADMMMAATDPTMPYPDPRGACKLDTGFPDDNACILPPDPKEGMQIHIGPTDYKDPDQINKFIFHAGEERSECWSFHTPNNQDIYYQTSTLSGRAGTHHIIDTMYKADVTDGGFTMCMDEFSTTGGIIDALPGASRAYHARSIVAPENQHIGRMVPAKAGAQADMHYFNFTDGDILREFWLNIYFAPKEQITTLATQIRGMGGFGWSRTPIAPGTDMVYQYSCPITSDGRILQLLGHYHSHGKRFTAYLHHANGNRDKVFEMYDYKDPRTFDYNTIVKNPEFSDAAPGAWTGELNVKSGDSLDWECHIVNDSDVGLTYVNMVKTGEMCNLWGASVDSMIGCFLP